MEHTYAVILAGGRGLRLNRTIPKQFLSLGGKPIIVWSLEACHSLAEIDHILTVIPDEYITQTDEIAQVFQIHKLLKIIPGGTTRQESAYNALTSLPFNDEDVLIFHDAARPFIRLEMLRKCVLETKEHGAAAVYVPIQETVAEIMNDFVSSVPPRDRMYYAQTPQGFKFSLIKSAHEAALRDGLTATDDVSLVLAAGFKVKMIEGEYSNFKITTDFDYQAASRMAETIHKKR